MVGGGQVSPHHRNPVTGTIRPTTWSRDRPVRNRGTLDAHPQPQPHQDVPGYIAAPIPALSYPYLSCAGYEPAGASPVGAGT
jgi:hypothetical protein